MGKKSKKKSESKSSDFFGSDNFFKNENYFKKILIHNTIFVDIEFGDDATGELNSPSNPFKTIGKALKVAKKNHPSKKNIWTINVSSGNYKEKLKVPKW